MKKLSVIAICLFMSFAVAAQSKPKFGLKGGLNVSTLNYNSGYDVDWKPGFHAGGLAHIHFTPSFSLQPEVYFSTQGAKIPYGNDKLNRNLNYVNVPVLLQYNFNNGFRLQGGPQIGFLLGAKDKLNGQDIHTVSTKDFKRVDFSLPLGVSYLFYSGLGLDGRYNLGLSNINDNGTVKIKNSVFQFGLFYLFDHKHKTETSTKGKKK